MIYIQTNEGLTPISSSLTKEKILAALGYTPADGASFFEDESGALVVADSNGYIIARLDDKGFTTTQVSASSIKLNDIDLIEKLNELESKASNVDLSNYYTKNEVDTHLNNEDIHVNSTDKEKWNNKSDFSGDYNDLNNAPNIMIENEEELVICDNNNNIIMRVDANGLNTTNLYLNNKLSLSNPLAGKKLSILGASISSYKGYCPSGYSVHYPKNDVTTVEQTWWKQLIDKNNMLFGANASYSGSTVQTDGRGVSYVADERISYLGSNGTPDIIIIQAGINDGDFEDLSTLGEINTNISIPLNSRSVSVYDTTTFLGAYQALLTKLLVTYPNAKIVPLSLTWTTLIPNNYTVVASNKIKELCDVYGLTFIDMRKCGINPANMMAYLSDGTHPNAAGMELMADYIEKCLA